MPSATYNAIRDAMVAKRNVTCMYQGYQRELSVHCIGLSKTNEEQILSYQFAGGSSKGLPPEGQWRCLEVRQITNVVAVAGAWHTGDSHLKPQTCVKVVDLEILT